MTRVPRSCPAIMAVLGACASLAACLDRDRIVDPRLTDFTAVRAPIVSNPVASPAPVPAPTATGSSFAGSAGSATDVVFVSLPPGTVPGGGLAIIENASTGDEVPAAMADGGFDPVPIVASRGDTLVLHITLAGGGTASFSVAVPLERTPIVVRTDPPPQKRDVPLNAAIVIVFSEPIDAATVSGIRLLRGGAVVSAGVVLATDGLRATLTADQALAPNVDYTLSIPTEVTDLGGESLEQPALVQFTTGTTVIVASVATDPVALVINPNGNALRTFAMRATLDGDDKVTGTFNIFYPEHGTRTFGRVTCFTIVDGNAAWVAGVAEGSGNPNAVGLEWGWRAVDHGPPGSAVPDQLSLAHPLEPGTLTGAEFCASTPLTDPDSAIGGVHEIQLLDLIGGDVVVNPSGPPPPPPPPSGVSEIAFSATNGTIQVIGADGTGGRRLTSGAWDWSPTWSPDGSEIAFHRHPDPESPADIYVIKADGSGLRRLTSDSSDELQPEWSPDGSRLVFGRDGAIYAMNASDGSGATALTNGGYDFHATWSPDGSRIGFASSRTGTNHIYVMNADGSGVTQLTSDTADDYHPRWSPDGTRIVFQRGPAGLGAIYVINPDGTGVQRVNLGGRTPAWSPDGQRIVYEQYGLTVISVDGSGMRFLGHGFDPAWTPLGTMPAVDQPSRSIELASGDGQTGIAGDTLPERLSVLVVLDDGSPAAGVTVAWFLFEAGLPDRPSLSSHFAVTDADGLAAVQLTLGATPGPVTVLAVVRDGSAHNPGVAFTAIGTPP